MTRLQKKCLFAAAGAHLLVVVVLLCSGFIKPTPKPDNTQVLDMIPSTVLDNVMNSGVKGAQPPPPTPPETKPPELTPPVPDPPKPVVVPTPKPPEPVKQPEKPPEKVQPEEIKEVEKPEIAIPKPPKKHEIKIDKTLVVRDAKKVDEDKKAAEKAAEAAAAAQAKLEAKQRAERLRAFRNVTQNIKNNTASETTVEMPGESSVSFANYASVVRTVYDRAWTPPPDMSSDEVNTKVSVVINRNGNVVSSRIIERSGESRVDASVQKALDRVDFVAPFPEGSTEKERTFIINFNPQARKSSG